jgi:hypothetical protein
MYQLARMTVFAHIIYLICSVGGLVQAQEPTKAAPIKINGMVVVTLDGPYQYNSGGVPLYGYITALNVSIDPKDNNLSDKSTYQATDKVEFHVCKTGKEISVAYGDLVHVKQGCGTAGRTWPETTAAWPEWKVEYGKLVVADQKANWQDLKLSKKVSNLRDIPISDLPVGYQSVLSSGKQGKTVAVTVPASDGSLLLGILPEQKM